MSVGANFLCGRPHGADTRPHASSWALPLPLPCERHKWMVPSTLQS